MQNSKAYGWATLLFYPKVKKVIIFQYLKKKIQLHFYGTNRKQTMTVIWFQDITTLVYPKIKDRTNFQFKKCIPYSMTYVQKKCIFNVVS